MTVRTSRCEWRKTSQKRKRRSARTECRVGSGYRRDLGFEDGKFGVTLCFCWDLSLTREILAHPKGACCVIYLLNSPPNRIWTFAQKPQKLDSDNRKHMLRRWQILFSGLICIKTRGLLGECGIWERSFIWPVPIIEQWTNHRYDPSLPWTVTKAIFFVLFHIPFEKAFL